MIKKIIIGGISAIALILIILITFYNINLGAINKDYGTKFAIKSGESATSVIKRLKEENLIKNELVVKIYCKLNNKISFQAGEYDLHQYMDVKTIINKFNTGDVIKDTITLKLVEGKRLIDYAEVISNTFSFDKEEVLNTLKDKEFLKELIDKYWFIDDSILKKDIYYPLEGYLYPDTYEFNKNANIKDVVNKLLSTLEKKINPYKEDIEKSDYSFHELLTLSSLIEAEAATDDDRKLVSGVFYNRLNDHWTLGSDVTAYYGVHKTFTDTIYQVDLDNCNPYNTRSNCVAGLPIGPINSPSFSAIYASIYPTSNDYYYFVADKTKKVYFSKTASEQGQIIQDLKNKGLWL